MSLIRPGTFRGAWHGDSASFDVQQVFPDGAFNGIGTFTAGTLNGVDFGFIGSNPPSGSLRVVRDVGVGSQVASDATFEISGTNCVWRGVTTGVGIPAGGLPFEFRVPSLIRLGTFGGLWHGQPVDFRF